MLEKGVIPKTEPLLRVGIVMPEDNFEQITLTLPSPQKYRLTADNRTQVSPDGNTLRFRMNQNKIILNNGRQAGEWKISASEPVILVPSGGIKVHSVVAGRGFHWQKPIDVFLPGALTIRMAGTNLILINELPLEDYLTCVATSEMGQACPQALIEAQTIVARSWMLANVEQKHIQLGMDVCNDDCCQRYQGTANLNQHSIDAARTSRGKTILYENKICDARYSKSCGGKMESFSTIWGGEDLPYLKPLVDFDRPVPEAEADLKDETQIKSWVDSVPEAFCSSRMVDEKTLKKYLGAVDEDGAYFRWQVCYSQKEIVALLNQKLQLQAGAILDLLALERGDSGRIKFLKIRYVDDRGTVKERELERDVAIRAALHQGFLYSSCIHITTGEYSGGVPGSFTLSGAGWGHGVGLCQIGALGMALSGYMADKILSHYYPGSTLQKIYP